MSGAIATKIVKSSIANIGTTWCDLEDILFSQKYWQELNLAIGHQIASAKILVDLNPVVQ